MGSSVGIDLHSNNNYIGIIDQENRRVFKKKSINDLSEIRHLLNAFQVFVLSHKLLVLLPPAA